MDWLTGSKQGETKRLISQLADFTKRDRAAEELIKLGADSVTPLMDALQTQDLNLLPVYQQILSQIPSATPALIKALTTAHPLVRGRVVEVLGNRKDKTAIPALLDALKGEYFTVRSRAALVLASFGDPHVIPGLLPLLKDKEDEVRIAACTALGKFREPTTFDDIANVLLDDSKIEVRRSAAKALGETKHPAAIPFLMEALHDSSWWYEREQAATDLMSAIENMDLTVVEPLIQELGDKEGTVRKLAATMLGNLGAASAIEELGMTLYDLHHEVGEAAAQALVKFGSKAVDVLLEAISHPEAGVRETAVHALGQIQDARIAPALIEMLKDPVRLVQSQAMRSLGNLRDHRALPSLQEIAADRSDRELSKLAKQIIELIK
jgi:HEAT repeat protein